MPTVWRQALAPETPRNVMTPRNFYKDTGHLQNMGDFPNQYTSLTRLSFTSTKDTKTSLCGFSVDLKKVLIPT